MDTSTLAVVIATFVGLAITFLLLKDSKKLETKNKGEKKSKVPATKKRFTKEEVAKHNTEEDLWIIIDGKVYDVTDYLEEHPGGEALMRNAGGDSTQGFKGDHHPRTVWEVIPMYHIGELEQ